MIPEQFFNYFLASAGAGAALIGLLFVAISIRPEHTLGAAHPVRKGVASGAFTALTNAFFVSMFALIPQTNVGVVAFFVGLIDVVVTLRLGRGLLRGPWREREEAVTWGAWWRLAVTLVLSAALYAYETLMGVTLIQQPHNTGAVLGICYVMAWVYAVGLARAWELLGGPGGGMSQWLNPLQGLDDATPASASKPPESAGAAPPSTGATVTSEPVHTPQQTIAPQPASRPHGEV